MTLRTIVASAFFAAACHTTTAPTTPPTTTPQGGAGPLRGTIATAQRIAAGQTLAEMDVPCVATFCVGPFDFTADPQTARLVTTTSSPSGAQACGLHANWVTSADAAETVAGVGCPEGNTAAEMEQTHTHSPGNGGSGANPVYLKFDRADPADCAPLRLRIARP